MSTVEFTAVTTTEFVAVPAAESFATAIIPVVARAMDEAGADAITPILVHTGQHYDHQMSTAFFADLNIPSPDIFLGVGSGSHAAQTAEIMKRFEEVLAKEYPHVVVVVGDVNSTLGCALVTAKMAEREGKPRPLIAHVEAGLRSFDRDMPEEVNRVLTDHLSDLLFVTEESGLKNLDREGILRERVFFVGNTMIDSLIAFQPQAAAATILQRLGLRPIANGNGVAGHVAPYALLTLHRPANVDRADSLVEILEGLQELALTHRIVFPAHPRTRKKIQEHGFEHYFQEAGQAAGNGCQRLEMIEPVGYIEFVSLMKNARLVVTDSGGIQEETTCLGVPCVTARENTERPVTIDKGTNVLGGVRRDTIRSAIRQQLSRARTPVTPEKWDGAAAKRIVEVLAGVASPASR